MIYPVSDVLLEIPDALRHQAESLFLGMWVQHEGRGLAKIAENLLIAADEAGLWSGNALAADSSLVSESSVNEWKLGLKAIVQAISRYDTKEKRSDHAGKRTDQGRNPLSRHGFVGHALYAAAWNTHQQQVSKGADYRAVQFFWLAIQAEVISAKGLTWSSWIAEHQEKRNKRDSDTDRETEDPLLRMLGLSFASVGLAIRRLAKEAHTPLLTHCANLCRQGKKQALDGFCDLGSVLSGMPSTTSPIQKERQAIADDFRRMAEKLLIPNFQRKIRSSTGSGGGRGGGSGGYEEEGANHQDQASCLTVSMDEPCEKVEELEHWIPVKEIFNLTDTEEMEGEAPRPLGLKLVRPEDVKGNLAKLKTQSHHTASVRQCFAWDVNALARSERSMMVQMLNKVILEPPSTKGLQWWAEAILCASWLTGRLPSEVMDLEFIPHTKISRQDLRRLGIGSADDQYHWRLPLRFPEAKKTEVFTTAIPKVDHIFVSDQSGLVRAMLEYRKTEAHQPAKPWSDSEKSQILKMVKDKLMSLTNPEVLGRKLSDVLVARDLRVNLLSMCPDKTIGWQIAGTYDDGKEPRMFYASHSPSELSSWMQAAHQKMITGDDGTSIGKMPHPGAWPETYAGAKFLPLMSGVTKLVEAAQKRAGEFPWASASKGNKTRKELWTAWMTWHNDVVFYAWLVQALQTSLRAIASPNGIYKQWLDVPNRCFISLEDKETRDRDEARSGVHSDQLKQAFGFMTQVQALVKNEVAKPDQDGLKKRVPKFPVGFQVFSKSGRVLSLKPGWITQHLLSDFNQKWPANFNRALLRRLLSQAGMHGDDLDAFMGHGDASDRVHDRHSLHGIGEFHARLKTELNAFAKQLNIKAPKIANRVRAGLSSEDRLRTQALTRLNDLEEEASKKRENRKISQRERDESAFGNWLQQVRNLIGKNKEPMDMATYRSWFMLLQQSHKRYAGYLESFGKSGSGLSANEVPDVQVRILNHQNAVEEFTQEVLNWVADAKMDRMVAARGFHLSFALARAIDPLMPTVPLAVAHRPRVSVFSSERMDAAVRMDQSRYALVKLIKTGETQDQAAIENVDAPKARLALASLIQAASEPEKLVAIYRRPVQPAMDKDQIILGDFNFKSKGRKDNWLERRGFIDLSLDLTMTRDAQRLSELEKFEDIYRAFRIRSAGMPTRSSGWTSGIRWFTHLHLPPLVASHLDGSLMDQSVDGPMSKMFGFGKAGRLSRVVSRSENANSDHQENGGFPTGLFNSSGLDPFGWVGAFDDKSEAAKWLKDYIFEHLGTGESTSEFELLSETLFSAVDDVPSRWMREVYSLACKLRKHHGLEVEDRLNGTGDRVDRKVIDYEHFDQILRTLATDVAKAANPERVERKRLLIVLAYRLGCRRSEILWLRSGDIDLDFDGRIHIRPYSGHTLKTGFSKRSVPLLPLLKPEEIEWLGAVRQAAAQTGGLSAPLFPKREHDGLSRDAIKTLKSVCQDNDLKLHHLRHSFASLMTLKLLVARNPEFANAFSRFPRTRAELQESPKLVGTVLKQYLSAGDFFVIPRLLGHSSYEVSVQNYVHTLDMAAALFIAQKYSETVVPRRYMCRLLGRRYTNARAMRQNASLPLPMQTNGVSSEVTANDNALRQQRLESTLTDSAINLKHFMAKSEVTEIKVNGVSLSASQIQNWLAPKKAVELKKKLIDGVALLSQQSTALLQTIFLKHWQPNPGILWFRHRPDASSVGNKAVITTQPQCSNSADVKALSEVLGIFKEMGLSGKEVHFWKYKDACPRQHAEHWGEIVRRAGFDYTVNERPSGARSAGVIGITLGDSGIKRSPLLDITLKLMSGRLTQMSVIPAQLPGGC